MIHSQTNPKFFESLNNNDGNVQKHLDTIQFNAGKDQINRNDKYQSM